MAGPKPLPFFLWAASGNFIPAYKPLTAPEYAIVNYVQKEFNPHLFMSFRSDFLDDKKDSEPVMPPSTARTH